MVFAYKHFSVFPLYPNLEYGVFDKTPPHKKKKRRDAVGEKYLNVNILRRWIN